MTFDYAHLIPVVPEIAVLVLASTLLLVTGVHLSYRPPARYGDTVRAACWVDKVSSRGVTFEYRIERGDPGLAVGQVLRYLDAIAPGSTLLDLLSESDPPLAAGLQPNLTLNPLQGMQTMTSYIAAAGSGDLSTGSIEYQSIFAVGLLLFVLTFFMNVISIRLVRRFRQVYQ